MNPYTGLSDKSFWSKGFRKSFPALPANLYTPKFTISKDTKIMTAGSCFAQYIGQSLKGLGFAVMDKESPNPYFFPKEHWKDFGYGSYTCRYGNIYTAAALLQLVREAFGVWEPKDSDLVWKNSEGKFFDSFRQSIEKDGFHSPEEVKLLRKYHLLKVKEALLEADLFVFTLGLTEAWLSKPDVVYQSAPGVIAGQYNESDFYFKNFSFSEIQKQMIDAIELIRQHNPKIKFLLTVSPVPLAATYSQSHVLVASILSKSILRAVAGDLHASYDFVDYFPSYEIISNPWTGSNNYLENLREIKPSSVKTVMDYFVISCGFSTESQLISSNLPQEIPDKNDIVCEEYLLDTFKDLK
jgi:hypothetical protein